MKMKYILLNLLIVSFLSISASAEDRIKVKILHIKAMTEIAASCDNGFRADAGDLFPRNIYVGTPDVWFRRIKIVASIPALQADLLHCSIWK